MERERGENGYNGWINYETWAVALWLDNDPASYHYWREQVERHRQGAHDDSSVKRGIIPAELAARCNLANHLKEEVSNASPLQEASIYADLLNAALSDVDWLEIVDQWLSD